ncbi:hypothetical protein MsAg5_00360 [Methanosarcinaceae archaeon Ag5]|uniref:Uncharacterized protein n=1 Tax=Methanolapillus africanus TaxID=3028297 RepID=A0AAE4MHU5_9EURY|nr:hypothetical protein [Methanosarcinaceae archaeon Ag5]
MVMKTLFRETLRSKFRALEVINAFLGFYIILMYAILWNLHFIPKVFVYLTPLVGLVLFLYHVKISSDLKKTLLDLTSPLNPKGLAPAGTFDLINPKLASRLASSTSICLGLFFAGIVCLVAACYFELTPLFIFALLFDLDHLLFVSIDKGHMKSEERKEKGKPVRALSAAV